jgi:hypothetical protein
MNKVLGKRMLTMELWKQNAFSAATFLYNSAACRVDTALCDHFLNIWDLKRAAWVSDIQGVTNESVL